MLVDKMEQKIEVGQWVIKPWDGTFDLGKVVKVTDHTFTYEYIDWRGNKATSICKVPDRCLVIPEILANYWSVLK